MSGDESGVLRDILASHRTLLSYIRTALSFAGLGFAVARFSLNTQHARIAESLGTLMVLVGFGLSVVGLIQHRALMRKLQPEAPGGRTHSVALYLLAGVGSALVCGLLAAYLIANTS
jgi:uncharacterized membrane protein YidH (DUF202 family)